MGEAESCQSEGMCVRRREGPEKNRKREVDKKADMLVVLTEFTTADAITLKPIELKNIFSSCLSHIASLLE